MYNINGKDTELLPIFFYFCNMQTISFHIAYLLTTHECVVIPGLGAFVSSKVERNSPEDTKLLYPPAWFLGFNPDIRHNDGLLAHSLAKGENCSYKEACLLIQRYVEQVNDLLENQKEVQIPRVGKLERTTERKIVFTPALQLSCNAGHFGLYPFYMPDLQELEESHQRPVPPKDVIYIPVNRQIIHWATATAAAVVALFVLSTPLGNRTAHDPQFATMISIPAITSPVAETPSLMENASVQPEKEALTQVSTIPEKEQQPETVIPEHNRYYYVVIASLPTATLAQQQLASYQKTGFSTPAVISKGNKHRIYVDKFEDKKEAETFLEKFRLQYPQHRDAWLLSQ
jgi:cell division septation protein DedD